MPGLPAGLLPVFIALAAFAALALFFLAPGQPAQADHSSAQIGIDISAASYEVLEGEAVLVIIQAQEAISVDVTGTVVATYASAADGPRATDDLESTSFPFTLTAQDPATTSATTISIQAKSDGVTEGDEQIWLHFTDLAPHTSSVEVIAPSPGATLTVKDAGAQLWGATLTSSRSTLSGYNKQGCSDVDATMTECDDGLTDYRIAYEGTDYRIQEFHFTLIGGSDGTILTLKFNALPPPAVRSGYTLRVGDDYFKTAAALWDRESKSAIWKNTDLIWDAGDEINLSLRETPLHSEGWHTILYPEQLAHSTDTSIPIYGCESDSATTTARCNEAERGLIDVDFTAGGVDWEVTEFRHNIKDDEYIFDRELEIHLDQDVTGAIHGHTLRVLMATSTVKLEPAGETQVATESGFTMQGRATSTMMTWHEIHFPLYATSTPTTLHFSTVPTPVDVPAVTPGKESLQVDWDAPASDGGLDVTTYQVQVKTSTSTDQVSTTGQYYDGWADAVGSTAHTPVWEATLSPMESGPGNGCDNNLSLSDCTRTLDDVDFVLDDGETYTIIQINTGDYLRNPTTGAVSRRPETGRAWMLASGGQAASPPDLSDYVLHVGGISFPMSEATVQLVNQNWLITLPDGKLFLRTDYASPSVDLKLVKRPATEAGVTGLNDGVSYDVRVRPVNDNGAGQWSYAASGTPQGVPGQPAGLTLTPGNEQLTAEWAVPKLTGLTAISRYDLEHKEIGAPDSYTTDNPANGWVGTPINNPTVSPEQTVWSATLTAKPTSGSTMGCTPNTFVCTTALTDNDFTLDGVTYQVNVVDTRNDGSSLEFRTTPLLPPDVAFYDLHVDGSVLSFSDATLSRFEAQFTSPGFFFTQDQTVQVKLVKRPTVTAPITGLENLTRYHVRVRAVNNEGHGDYSGWAAATPVPPGTYWAAKLAAQDLDNHEGSGCIANSNNPANLCSTPATLEHQTFAYEGVNYWVTEVVAATTTLKVILDKAIPTAFDSLAFQVNAGQADEDQYLFSDAAKSNSDKTATWTVTEPAWALTGETVQLSIADGVPSRPTGLSLAAGNGQLTASWTAPPSPPSAPITGYDVHYKRWNTATSSPVTTDPTTGWVERTVPTSASTVTITGLENEQRYDVRVRAVNSRGDGAWSEQVREAPLSPGNIWYAALEAPALTNVLPGHYGCINQSQFDQCSEADRLSDDRFTYEGVEYQVTQLVRNGDGHLILILDKAIPAAFDSLAITVDGGDPLLFVDAVKSNSDKTATWTSAGLAWAHRDIVELIIGEAVPSRPTGLALTAGNGQLVASWKAPPSPPSAPITGYDVWYKLTTAATSTQPVADPTTGWVEKTVNPEAETLQVWSATLTVGELTAGLLTGCTSNPDLDSGLHCTRLLTDRTITYDGETYTITAISENNGLQIDFDKAFPESLKKTANLVIGGSTYSLDADATLTNNGTALVLGVVSGWPSAGSTVDFTLTVADGRSLTITGLENEERYDVRVRAVNSRGDGGWSAQAREAPLSPGNVWYGFLVAPVLHAAGFTGSHGCVNSWPNDVCSDADRLSPKDRFTHQGVEYKVTELRNGSTSTSHLILSLDQTIPAAFDSLAVRVDGGDPLPFASAVKSNSGMTATFESAGLSWAHGETHELIIGVSGVPYGLQVKQTETTLKVTWTAPPGDAGANLDGYDVWYKKSSAPDTTTAGSDPDTGWVDAGHVGTAATVTISKLDTYARYDVRVRAVDNDAPAADREGEWSGAVTGRPAPEGAVFEYEGTLTVGNVGVPQFGMGCGKPETPTPRDAGADCAAGDLSSASFDFRGETYQFAYVNLRPYDGMLSSNGNLRVALKSRVNNLGLLTLLVDGQEFRFRDGSGDGCHYCNGAEGDV